MTKLKKYFGEYNMTWGKVLLLAVITAVVTAALNLIPALKDTSFQDIAVNLDVWFLFAVFIIVNCDKWWEAALKCFVFFLISQPLIYLLEVPFNDMGWKLFDYYGYWFKVTLLTLPGAVIAFLLKKKNWLSVAVLSVATGYLAFMSVRYFRSACAMFPHHLLSCIFCIVLAVFFVFVLLDEKKHRAAALVIILLVLAVSIGLLLIHNMGGSTCEFDLEDGTWSYTVDTPDVVSVEIDGGHVTVTSERSGYCLIDFENENGEVVTYAVLVDGANISVSPVD